MKQAIQCRSCDVVLMVKNVATFRGRCDACRKREQRAQERPALPIPKRCMCGCGRPIAQPVRKNRSWRGHPMGGIPRLFYKHHRSLPSARRLYREPNVERHGLWYAMRMGLVTAPGVKLDRWPRWD